MQVLKFFVILKQQFLGSHYTFVTSTCDVRISSANYAEILVFLKCKYNQS